MSSWSSLKKGGKVISLDTSSSEENKEPNSPVNEEAAEGKEAAVASKAESHMPAVKVEKTEPDDTSSKKRKACDMIWREHTGFGLCRGSNQLPCSFGKDGLPAQAGPCSRCDLCSSDALEALHDGMPQRVTHLLSNLHGKPLKHAFVRIKIVLGKAAEADYKMRRQRVLQRRNPHRPKR
ncbi:unnamed protein product, partial [Symbiodinium sp. CCMP2456]